MQDQLVKFRGWQSNGDTPAIELLTKYDLLMKDAKKGEMDPFLYKVLAQAPTKK